ncbi:unnamed protein product [Paramecium sonneborni]|uniref:Uncharacterized protein n=1 Tax=Paramecium sonneborni TaxID=65129 RepID=A0A8S1N670_9CILI|nr:unnamed protein product [Paramecium sonneborni]
MPFIQKIIRNGYSPENVNCFTHNDIAQNRQNIQRSITQLNKEEFSANIYEGYVIDYSKSDINPKNFLNVSDFDKFINIQCFYQRVLLGTNNIEKRKIYLKNTFQYLMKIF